MLHLTLPLPPTINHCYITTRRGQRVLTAEGKEWIEIAQKRAKKAVQEQGWTVKPKKQVVIEIDTYFPDKRRRDCHNGAKLTMDGLEKVLYDDDRYVLPRYMLVEIDKQNPRIDLRIYYKEDGWRI